MVAYQHFIALSNSSNTEHRGEAAHMVATAFIEHDGPQDERAALYASMLGFLDDSSAKVRGSLALALLRSELAPRLIMLSLAKDAAIIARAVVQYSPVLLDVDLIGIAKVAEPGVLLALSCRENLSEKLIDRLALSGDERVIKSLLSRQELEIAKEALGKLVQTHGHVASIRGKLLARKELSASCRLQLVENIKQDLCQNKMVKGAIAAGRLERITRDALDSSASRIGEEQSMAGNDEFALYMQDNKRINTRLLIHCVINGQVLFFADCIALIGEIPPKKVFALLKGGARASLNVLFHQCGMSEPMRNLMARLIMYARDADLSCDDGARHFVVSAIIEELIIEHEGDIPHSLQDAFRYLDEQNMVFAKAAARGVMPAFAQNIDQNQELAFRQGLSQVSGQVAEDEHSFAPERLALPAA
ncbi:hypothetical protein MNBD_ALPHA11-932 [hydrothermal vent metagenome]|uniref:DUF2336 domain-containing protein n=1 Tax=hydrothermal vent metagenome TaxID=652676 RepID=A0A3B0TVI6_9ZZZZ